MTKEIESAVEILQDIIDYDWKNLDQESYKQTLREKIKPLMLLFLEVRGMPEKKEVRMETNKRQMKIGSNEIIDVETRIHYDKEAEAFNSCLDLCTAHLVKKCEGIEDVLRKYSKYSEEYSRFYISSDEFTDLSQAIKEYLVKGEEK